MAKPKLFKKSIIRNSDNNRKLCLMLLLFLDASLWTSSQCLASKNIKAVWLLCKYFLFLLVIVIKIKKIMNAKGKRRLVNMWKIKWDGEGIK